MEKEQIKNTDKQTNQQTFSQLRTPSKYLEKDSPFKPGFVYFIETNVKRNCRRMSKLAMTAWDGW
jgi:hypothetical protein